MENSNCFVILDQMSGFSDSRGKFEDFQKFARTFGERGECLGNFTNLEFVNVAK